MIWDDKWEDFYANGSGNRYPDPAVVRFVLGNFGNVADRSQIRILDLGSGRGGNLWLLAREGFSVYGIDGSPASIELAQSLLQKDNLNADISLGDFSALKFADGFFNAVIDGASIQHNDRPSIHQILNEVHRVLKVGGCFFSMLLSQDQNLSACEFFTESFKESDIELIYDQFDNLEINHLHYTEDHGRRFIRFYLINAKKNRDR